MSWSAGALLISNIGDSVIVLRILAVVFFRYTNNDLRNNTNQRRKHKTWTREDKQLALHYFRSNLTQRGYWKRMIDIWQERVSFQTTSQKLVEKARKIIKKSWFSDFEIQEMHQKRNSEQVGITISSTSSINKQKHPNRKLRKIETLHNQTTHYQTTQKKHYHMNQS